jgi:hypothetical protein
VYNALATDRSVVDVPLAVRGVMSSLVRSSTSAAIVV